MRRRRQQKLEKKLQQFRSRDGGMYYLELFEVKKLEILHMFCLNDVIY